MAGRWILLIALSPAVAGAQVLQVQAGTSTLYDARGAEVEIRGTDTSWLVGAGTLQGRAIIGGRAEFRTRRAIVRAGDDTMDFRLPTDFSNATRYVPLRGIGATFAARPRIRVKVFAGGTSRAAGAPFFQAATWDEPALVTFVDVPLTPRVRLSSRNANGRRQTSIQSLHWQHAGIEAAASGGIGMNRGYWAVNTGAERPAFEVRAAYAAPAAAFRRVDTVSPMGAENEREAVSATLHPMPWWRLSASRQNLVDPNVRQGIMRATVNQATGTLDVAGFRWTSGVFTTQRADGRLFGTSAAVGRALGSSLDLGADYFLSKASDGSRSESLSLRVREAFGPRLSLLQVFSRNGDTTTANVGGQFISNTLIADVGYQTTYAPLRPTPFVRTIALDVKVNLFGAQISAATYVTPDGSLRFTVSGRAIHAMAGRSREETPSQPLGRYLFAGRVIDTRGLPVAGAALRIGDEYLLTAEDGAFSLRVMRARAARLTVLPDEFASADTFTIVSAPDQVTPAPTSAPAPVTVVVRRMLRIADAPATAAIERDDPPHAGDDPHLPESSR